MRKLVWGLCLFPLLAAAGAVQGQTVLPGGPDATVCVYNATLPTLTTGAKGFLQCDASGRLLLGSANQSMAVYGLTAPGAAPSGNGANPFLNGFLDAGGLIQPVSPNAPLPVAQQDGLTTTLSASSAAPLTNATYTTGAISTTGFASFSVQLTVNAGNTVTYEQSNDGVTWINTVGNPPSNTGNGAPSATDNGTTIRNFPVTSSFFRVRVSTYVSGTVTAVVTMKVTNVSSLGVYVGNPITVAPITSSNSGGVNATSRIASAAAGTNLTTAKSSGGRVYKIRGFNAAAAPRRLRLYNTASVGAVTVGTTTIFDEFILPVGAFSFDMADIGWSMPTGITYAFTVNAADNDTVGLTAGDITDFSIAYQ